MDKFIEVEVELINNDPDDETDYESLGIDRPDEKEMCNVLFNVDDIQRVNESATNEFETVFWTFSGQGYNTNVPYDKFKSILKPIEVI